MPYFGAHEPLVSRLCDLQAEVASGDAGWHLPQSMAAGSYQRNSLVLSKRGKKLTGGQLSEPVLIESSVISTATAAIVWPGQAVTMTTPSTLQPAAAAASRKVLLAAWPAPTIKEVKPSSPSLWCLLLTWTQNEACTSEAAVQLLLRRGTVTAQPSASAKGIKACCPRKRFVLIQSRRNKIKIKIKS